MTLLVKVFKVIFVVATILALGFLCFSYCAFCPSMNEALLNRALFHPIKEKNYKAEMYRIDDFDGEDVQFRYQANSPLLHGIFYKHPSSKFVCIVNHGNGGNIIASRPVAECLLASKSSVLIYDYRGYGKSEGKPGVKGVVDDARAAYNYVKNKLKFNAKHIMFYGASLGSGITSELAKEKKCFGIIYDSPFLSPERLAKESMPFFNIYPSFLWFKPSLSNAEYVRTVHPPLLIVSAKEDSVIPVTHSKRLYKLCSGNKTMKVFNHSQHTWYQNDFEDYKRTIQEFVATIQKPLLMDKTTGQDSFAAIQN